MTIDYDELYPSFTYDRPRDGVLRVTFDAPGLNSVGPDAHREIAEIWQTVDRDPDVQVAAIGPGLAVAAALDEDGAAVFGVAVMG